MKILLVSPLPPPSGGIATWTNSYLSSSQARHNDIDIVNTAVKGNRIDNFTKKSTLEEVKRTIYILKDIKLKLRTNQPDIVHVNTSCSKFGMIRDLICLKRAKKSKAKTVLHCHCDTSYMVNNKLSEIIFKKICKKADRILVLNSFSHEHIKMLVGRESKIIPNFIKEDLLNIKSVNKVSDKIKNILFVGHIVKSKGCEDIISVARQMPEKTFTMIGYLSDEIKQIKTPNNVKYLSEISHQEVLNHMKSSDLFLLPTYTEGFPNVVLEAMACGMPIVSTNVGAIPDIIENKGGIIINSNDIKAIKLAIEKLDEPKIRLEMIKWNLRKVKENYTLDKVMNIIFTQYRDIMKED